MMTSTEEKCKSLQERLNLFPDAPAEGTHKLQPSSIEEHFKKLQEGYENESVMNELKMKEMLQMLKKLEFGVKEHCTALLEKEDRNKMKIARVEKNIQKAIDNISKERKQTEKRINSSHQACLIELTSAKAKSLSACKFAIKQFTNLENTINLLQAEVQNEESVTQEINKKIFAQYSSQMQELSDILSEERKEKEMEESKIMDKLEKMYLKIHKQVEDSRRLRETNEEDVINFLEKVIERVKREMLRR